MTDAFEILKEFVDYLHVSSVFSTLARIMGWWILKIFSIPLDAVSKILDQVYKLVEFPMSKGVQDFITDNNISIYSIGGVCLSWFFIRYMKNRNMKMNNLVDNLLLGIIVVITSSLVITSLTTGTFKVAKAIYSDKGSTSTAIFNENIVDVLSLDRQGWESTEEVSTIDLSKNKLKFLDITQEIDQDKVDFESKVSKEVFSNKVENDPNNKLEMVKLSSGFSKVDEHYYRYSWHPFLIFFQLNISFWIIILVCYKYLIAIYNIGFNSIIAPFFAFSDLAEATKVKKIIQGIINTCTNVVLFAVSMKVYRLFSTYLGTQDIDGIVKVILQIMMVIVVIEGPWIIQELTGQESGLKSSVGRVAAIGGAALLGTKGAKGLKNVPDLAKKAKEGSRKASDWMANKANLVAGMANGASENMKDNLAPKLKKKDGKDQNNPANLAGLSKEEKHSIKDELNNTSSDMPMGDDMKASDQKIPGNETDRRSSPSETTVPLDDLDTRPTSDTLNESGTTATASEDKATIQEENKKMNASMKESKGNQPLPKGKPSTTDNVKASEERTQAMTKADAKKEDGKMQGVQGIENDRGPVPHHAQKHAQTISRQLSPSNTLSQRVSAPKTGSPHVSPRPLTSTFSPVRPISASDSVLQSNDRAVNLTQPQSVLLPNHVRHSEGHELLTRDTQVIRPPSTNQSLQTIRADKKLEKQMKKVARGRERQYQFDLGRNTTRNNHQEGDHE